MDRDLRRTAVCRKPQAWFHHQTVRSGPAGRSLHPLVCTLTMSLPGEPSTGNACHTCQTHCPCWPRRPGRGTRSCTSHVCTVRLSSFIGQDHGDLGGHVQLSSNLASPRSPLNQDVVDIRHPGSLGDNHKNVATVPFMPICQRSTG